MNKATKSEIETIAIELMTQHGLIDSGWYFEFDNAKRRLGRCSHTKNKITLSSHYCKIRTLGEIINTILHEIAHALVGYEHGHDRVWKQKAIEIGCDGERLYKGKARVEGKFKAVCGNCGTVSFRYRKTERMNNTACGKCCNEYNGGRYSDKYQLIYKPNY